MAKGRNQKLKLLYLMRIFLEKTDENHSISMSEIISSLEAYGVTAERKSIYDDIECLRTYGIDIIGENNEKGYKYYVGSRLFELPELKLLVDSIQSAKFITAKKSNELIKKLESFASKYEASQLQRQVYVSERVKTMNESIYYNVDFIHSAINANSKITFQYFNWDVNKKMVLRHNGERYKLSPWALTCDNDNYYLIAYDSKQEKIKHFRVDKMLKIEIIDEEREGVDIFKAFDMATYSKKMFGMFTGEEQLVKLECANNMAGVIIDRFGKDLSFNKISSDVFTVNVKVVLSPQFFSWLMSLGEGVKLVAPDTAVEKMKKEIQSLRSIYEV